MRLLDSQTVQVIIHFGPPKTGTSTIQKWLLSHREWLENHGIYYPDHTVDVNGVSSGNMWSVLTKAKNGNLVFDKKAFQNIVKTTETLECTKLLLSSEFFFKNLVEIAKEVPQAIFVGYVRFGLDVLQSGYNQRVKRHGCTEKFVETVVREKTLTQLSSLITRIGNERFHLKAFSKNCFSKNDLVSDFLHTLLPSVNIAEVPTKINKVNSSYSLEALEVKRWFNQFPEGQLQVQLDNALQDYGSTESYSLFTPEMFQECKIFYLNQIELFTENHNVIGRDTLIEDCKIKENNTFYVQNLSADEFKQVIQDLVFSGAIPSSLFYQLYHAKKNSKDSIDEPERLEYLYKALRLSFRIKMHLRAILLMVKH